MKQRDAIKARDKGIITLRVFVTPEERDLIQQACKDNGFTMAHALRILGLDWAEGVETPASWYRDPDNLQF